MGYGDFTPASHSYKKPISKKELKKLQENYAKADEVSKLARELEEEEKQKTSKEMDELLDDII